MAASRVLLLAIFAARGASAFSVAPLGNRPSAPRIATHVARPRACPPAMLGGNDVPISERALGCLVYMLPALDGFVYGTYVYSHVPGLAPIAYSFLPAVNAFQSIPFAGLALFIGFSFFSRNQNLSRFLRFNIQQALLLDIALIIPSVLGPAANIFPELLQLVGQNFVFYSWFLAVAYAVVCNVQGKVPDQVPIISDAARMQIGPW